VKSARAWMIMMPSSRN